MGDKISLYELQERIKKGVEGAVPGYIWITAEISDVNNNVSGHCYLDLIDYKENEKGISAKARGMIWANTYRMLRPYFETTAGSPLKAGMKVLLKVQVQYSLIYGLGLTISDIDPTFTVGGMELIRQQTIQKLQSEGCFELNSKTQLTLLPRNLAIISSETAAGYRDFIKHLHNNEYGYSFNTELFQAQMQGDEAPESVINALERIYADIDSYDAVILIRGGGAVTDMVCFDDYNLCTNIAHFPIPVITGIGHDHDYHIADMVAHTYLKTPTAVAAFIIDLFMQEDMHLSSIFQRLTYALNTKTVAEVNLLDQIQNRIAISCNKIIRDKEHKVDLLQMRIASLDPSDVLKRGFAVIYKGSARVKSVDDMEAGAEYQVQLNDGVAKIFVNKILEIKKERLDYGKD